MTFLIFKSWNKSHFAHFKQLVPKIRRTEATPEQAIVKYSCTTGGEYTERDPIKLQFQSWNKRCKTIKKMWPLKSDFYIQHRCLVVTSILYPWKEFRRHLCTFWLIRGASFLMQHSSRALKFLPKCLTIWLYCITWRILSLANTAAVKSEHTCRVSDKELVTVKFQVFPLLSLIDTLSLKDGLLRDNLMSIYCVTFEEKLDFLFGNIAQLMYATLR